MTFAIPDHIAYCDIEGRTALLDIRRGRYFALPEDLEQPFRSVSNGGRSPSAAEQKRLLAQGLLGASPRTRRLQVDRPGVSLVEGASGGRVSMATLISVAKDVRQARRSIGRETFAAIVGRLEARRATDAQADDATVDDRLKTEVLRFVAARRYVPSAPVCFQDSLAMIEHLARHGLHAHLVFGVTLAPFGAHCWLQVHDVVLNDALDRARGHTPILVI